MPGHGVLCRIDLNPLENTLPDPDVSPGPVPRGVGSRVHEEAVRLPTVTACVTVLCQECGREPAGDSPELRLELTDDEEAIVYREECWDTDSAKG